MRKKIFLLTALFSISANADAPFALRVEKNDYGVFSQLALTFDTSGVSRATRNSTFACPVKNEAWLGSFEREDDTSLQSLRNLAAQQSKYLKRAEVRGLASSVDVGEHAVRSFLGAFEVSGNAAFEPWVSRAIDLTCDLSEWKPLDAVKVELQKLKKVLVTRFKSGKQVSSEALSFDTARCKKAESYGHVVCDLAGWGRVFLKE